MIAPVLLGRAAMAIYRLFQNLPLDADVKDVLGQAYERTLRKLSLVDRDDPVTQLVAKKIMDIGQRGVRDPKRLSELTIKELGVE